MTMLPRGDQGLPVLLAHPLTIVSSCAGSALFAVLGHQALLAAVPPDCMRASVLRILPAVAWLVCFSFALTAALSGMFYRVRPNPRWSELVWAAATGPAIVHAALFALSAVTYAAAVIPADCESPSLIDLGLIGLCQLAHVGQLVWNARRVTELRRTMEVRHG